jgi:galactokinase
MVNKIKQVFKENFNEEPLIVRSPGRVNIIGEHTDYNDGFVLPAAIDKAIYVAITKRNDNTINLYSVDFKEWFTVEIANVQPTKNWATYILGVVNQLTGRGYTISGFNLVIDGDVPIGAGLSSSAAVECATVFALNQLYNLRLSKIEMIQIAQKAEHTFSGVMCGIMDMFTSIMGKENHVIKLDCRSLEYEYKPLKLEGYKLVLFNTNVKHSLASSAYNQRRQQCQQGVAWVQHKHPQVQSLRDVSMQMLHEIVQPKDELIFTRCKFVVEEIDRLLKGCINLENGDIAGLGQKMFATHHGLSTQYEVSCTELDYLVNAVKNNPAVLGARMMGGGFGGCTINIVKDDAIAELTYKLTEDYKRNTGLNLTSYVAVISNGTSIV